MEYRNPFEDIDKRLNQIESVLNKLSSKKSEAEPTKKEKFLTTEEVCELLSISRVTLWTWDKKDVTRPIRFGNLKRYRQSDIENMGE